MAAKVVLITGCSTGVGQALAVILAASSAPTYRVYATMRNLSKQNALVEAAGQTLNKSLFVRELDVCNSSSVSTAIADIVRAEGRIDILVNNAGVGVSGPLEAFSVEAAKDNFETNFFGVYRTTQAVLPHMKAQNSGHIVQVSTMGACRGVPFNDVYCAAKFAVEGLSESLAPMLHCFNVKMSLIEPGPILTDFVANAMKSSTLEIDTLNVDDKTKSLLKTYKERMLAGFNPAAAETSLQCAEKIKKVIESENPPFRTQTNANYAPIAAGKWVDPTGAADVTLYHSRFFA